MDSTDSDMSRIAQLENIINAEFMNRISPSDVGFITGSTFTES